MLLLFFTLGGFLSLAFSGNKYLMNKGLEKRREQYLLQILVKCAIVQVLNKKVDSIFCEQIVYKHNLKTKVWNKGKLVQPRPQQIFSL